MAELDVTPVGLPASCQRCSVRLPMPDAATLTRAEYAAAVRRGDKPIRILPARYARGKVAAHVASDGSGWKTAAARLAENVGGRWTHRERAYIMSQRQADRLLKLYADGAVGAIMSRDITTADELHRQAVILALRHGSEVPARVLADYPELTTGLPSAMPAR
jgi:hypothetical protein